MTRAAPRPPKLRCTCGARKLFAVQPGTEMQLAPGGILIRRPIADVGWCRRCWVETFPSIVRKGA